jgi:hypothetical protein
MRRAPANENYRMTDLVAAYWRQYELSTSENREDRQVAEQFFWAWEEVEARMDDLSGTEAVELLVLLAEAAPTDAALGYLGAGPVENLLVSRTANVVDEVDAAARRNEKFRTALAAAWYDDHLPVEIAARLRRFGEAT